MDIGEAIGIGLVNVREQAPKCKEKDKEEKLDWEARVNGLGKDGTKCSGGNLFNSMKPRKEEHFKKKNLGYVPEKKSNDYWATNGLSVVGPENFPLQAHHLIPKNFLPKQGVCVWLCEKDKRHDDYELKGDTFYNTDHANNGYAMPYATKLKEWKSASNATDKCNVAFKVMEKTGVQLHQGSHAGVLDLAKVNSYLPEGSTLGGPSPAAAGSDEMEEDSIHAPGYLNYIKKWLNAAAAQIQTHVENCTEGCKEAADGGKTKVRPIEDSVRMMNQVSYITKVFLEMNLIFTCPYGAAYAAQKDLLTWDENEQVYRAVGVKKDVLKAALSR